ncbi:retrovirus-related pol polyprotein from transposon TNT 1-94 [Tanacetum coccineum]
MTPPHFNTYQSSYNNSQLQQQFSPSQFGLIHPNQHYSSTYPSQPQFNHSSVPSSYPYQSQMNHQTSFVPQIAYQSPQVTTQPMTESPLMDLSFAISVFSPGDDLIAYLNKAMDFLTVVAYSRFPSTNNQLRTSLNPRNQATIQDGKVIVQQVQGRQGQSYSGTGYKSNATSSTGNNISEQARVVKCYNCQGEGHMARQCTQPK